MNIYDIKSGIIRNLGDRGGYAVPFIGNSIVENPEDFDTPTRLTLEEYKQLPLEHRVHNTPMNKGRKWKNTNMTYF